MPSCPAVTAAVVPKVPDVAGVLGAIVVLGVSGMLLVIADPIERTPRTAVEMRPVSHRSGARDALVSGSIGRP